MSTPILMGHPLSPYVRKARLLLHFAGIEHALRPLPPGGGDEVFRAASPLGKIPALQHGDLGLADSTVILHYAVRFLGGQVLLPEDAQGFTRALWWEEYADGQLVPVIGGHLFAEVVLAGRLFPREPLQTDIDKARGTELPAIYGFLEKHVRQGRWLVAEQPCIADLAVGGMLIALQHCGDVIPAEFPALADFVRRFMQLPAVGEVLPAELAALKQMGYVSPLA